MVFVIVVVVVVVCNCELQHGYTALHLAAQQGHSDTINILLENGANVEAVANVQLCMTNNDSYLYVFILIYIPSSEACHSCSLSVLCQSVYFPH